MPRDAGVQCRVFQSTADVAVAVADVIEQVIAARPTAVLALATGRTPLAIYEELARRRQAGRLEMSRARLFAIDEFAGVPIGHPGSFAAYLDRHLVVPLGFDPGRVERLNGVSPDPDRECDRYE